MTNAIRSFKLEEEEAQTVVDTYSAIAASSATSVSELATAMSKTASSAASVGSTLQETTAIMATMIEATRESATNIGSSLKSIISRYGELKEDPKALIDSEGEELSLNKVDKALQSVGISLHDSNGEFKNFTDVIRELAGIWDTLGTNAQRYIATIMAGNRQQSRFLALVSSGERLEELIGIANDSENASDLQVLKTMDSIEYKAQQVKTTIQSLYTDAGLQNFYKGFLDFENRFAQSFVNFSTALGTPIAALTKLGTGFFTLAKTVTTVFKIIKTTIANQTRQTETEIRIAEQGGLSNYQTTEFEKQLSSARTQKEITDIYKQEIEKRKQLALEQNSTEQAINNERLAREQAVANARLRLQQKSSAWGIGLSMLGMTASTFASQMSDTTQGQRLAKAGVSLGGSIASGAAMMLMMPGPIGKVVGAFTALTGIVEAATVAFISDEEALRRLNEQAEKSNQTFMQNQSETKNLEKSLKELEKLKEARYDSVEAMEAYREASDQIAEKYPELVSAYDNEGRAILDLNTAYERLHELRGETVGTAASAIATSEQAANEAEKQAKEIFEGAKGSYYQQLAAKEVTEDINGTDLSTPAIQYYFSKAFKNENGWVTSNLGSIYSGTVLSMFEQMLAGNGEEVYETYQRLLELVSAQITWMENNNITLSEEAQQAWETFKSLMDAALPYEQGEYSKVQKAESKHASGRRSKIAALTPTLVNDEYDYKLYDNDETNNYDKQVLDFFSNRNAYITESILRNMKAAEDNDIYDFSIEDEVNKFLDTDTSAEEWLEFVNKNLDIMPDVNELVGNADIYSRDQLKNNILKLFEDKGSNIDDTVIKWVEIIVDTELPTSEELASNRLVAKDFGEGQNFWSRLYTGDNPINSLDLSETELTSIAKTYEYYTDQVKQGSMTLQQAQAAYDAYIDAWAALGENEDAQKILKGWTDFSVSGVQKLEEDLKEAGLKETEITQIINAATKSIMAHGINISLEIDTLSHNASEAISDLDKAIKNAVDGMDRSEAEKMADRLGANLDKDFDLINGKYYYKELNNIVDSYWTQPIEKLNEKIEQQIAALPKDSTIITKDINEKNVWEAFYTQYEAQGFSSSEIVSYFKEWQESGSEETFEQFIVTKLTNDKERLDKLQAYEQDYIVRSFISAGQITDALGKLGYKDDDADAIIAAIKTGDLSKIPDVVKQYYGLMANALNNSASTIINNITKGKTFQLSTKDIDDDTFEKLESTEYKNLVTIKDGQVTFAAVTQQNIDTYVELVKALSTDADQLAANLDTLYSLLYTDVDSAISGILKNPNKVTQTQKQSFIKALGLTEVQAESFFTDVGEGKSKVDFQELVKYVQDATNNVSESVKNLLFSTIKNNLDNATSYITKGVSDASKAEDFVAAYNTLVDGEEADFDSLFTYDTELNAYKLNLDAYRKFIRNTVNSFQGNAKAINNFIDQQVAELEKNIDITKFIGKSLSSSELENFDETIVEILTARYGAIWSEAKILLEASEYSTTLRSGGREAVKAAKLLLGRELTSEEIEALYSGPELLYQSYIDSLDNLKEGSAVVDADLRAILSGEGIGYKFNDQGVIISVGNKVEAYKAINEAMSRTSTATAEELNANYAKQFAEETKAVTAVKDILGNVRGISVEAMSSYFEAIGEKVELSKLSDQDLQKYGFGKDQFGYYITDIMAVFEKLTPEQKQSKEWISIASAAVDSMISNMDDIVTKSSQQISGLFSGKIGAHVNTTYLSESAINAIFKDINGQIAEYTKYTLTNIVTYSKSLLTNPKSAEDIEFINQYVSMLDSAISGLTTEKIGGRLDANTSAILAATGNWQTDEQGLIVLKSAEDYLRAVGDLYAAVKDSFTSGYASLNTLNNAYLNIIKANTSAQSAGLTVLNSASSLSAEAINTFVNAFGGALETVLTETGEVRDQFKGMITKTGIGSYKISSWEQFVGMYAAVTGEFIDTTSKQYIDAYSNYLKSQQEEDSSKMLASVLPNAGALDYTQIATIAKALNVSLTEVLNNTYKNLDGTFNAVDYLLEKIGNNDYLKSLIQPASYDSAISLMSDLGTTQTSGITSMKTMTDKVKEINDELHLATDLTVDSLFSWNNELHAYVYTVEGIQYSIELARARLAQAGKEEDDIKEILAQQAGYDFLGNLDITGFISGGFKQSDWDKINQGLNNYTIAMGQIGVELPDFAKDIWKTALNLQAGGEDAVQEIKDLYEASGREITSEEIVAAYRGQVEAIKKLNVNLGDTIDANTAHILGLEVKEGESVVVVKSIEQLITAYTSIYTQLKNSSEATFQEINAAAAKVLTAEDQSQIDAISAMKNAFGMSWDTLGELFAKAGKNMAAELTSQEQMTAYGLMRTGTGGVNILDFEKFAGQMGWAKGSEEYVSAFKTYNDSLIKYNKTVESEIISEIGNLSNLKVGQQFNVTYLMDALSGYKIGVDKGLTAALEKYGIVIKDGILEVINPSNFDTQGALTTVARYLSGMNDNGQYNEAIQSLMTTIMNIVPNAISELSKVEFNKPLTGTTAEILSKSETWEAEFQQLGTATINSAQEYAEACKLVYQAAQEGFESGTSNITALNSAYKQLINSQVENVERAAKLNVLSSANSLNLDSLETFFNQLGLQMSDYINEFGYITSKGRTAGLDSQVRGQFKIVNWAQFRASFAGEINEYADEYIDAYISYLSSSETEGINTKEAFMASLIPSLNKLSYAQVGEIAKRFDLTVEEVIAMLKDNGDGTFNGSALYNELDFDKNNEAVQKAYTEAVKGYASGLSSAIVNFSSALYNGKAGREVASEALDKAIDEYIKGMQSLGQAVSIDRERIEGILLSGGERAVKMAQEIAQLSGTVLSESDISTLYYANADELINAIEKIGANAGEIVNQTTANIIRGSGGKVNQLGATGQYVVESAGNLVEAYKIIYDRLVASGKATTSQLNSLVAKQLELEHGSAAIEVLGDAASMTYTRFGEILAAQGIELTKELVKTLEDTNLIKDLGGGKMAITDFDAFASMMGWAKNSEAYTSAFKTYNDSLISMNKQVEQNILAEVKSVSEAKGGDQVNLTQLVSKLTKEELENLQNYLLEAGASLENGILTLGDNANIPAIIQELARQAQAHGSLIASEMAELADTLEATLKNYASLIQTGMSGSLTNVQAQQLQQWATNSGVDLTFTRTAKGLKISRDSAWELYTALEQIDSLAAGDVFNSIVDSYTKDVGGGMQTANETLAEQVRIQQKIKENEAEIETIRERITAQTKVMASATTDAQRNAIAETVANDHERLAAIQQQNASLNEQVSILGQIANAQASNPDSFKFMDRALPSNLQGPMNYWNSIGKMFTTMNESASTGRMEMQDFYNIVNEFSNLAAISGQKLVVGGVTLDGSAEQAAALIEKGFGALNNIDGKGVMVNLKKIGIDFSSGASDLRGGVQEGFKAVAESQIAMLDAAIQILEVIVKMEELGDIELEDGILGFTLGDIFKNEQGEDRSFTKGYQDWVDSLEKVDPESDLGKALNNIKIGGQNLLDIIKDTGESLGLTKEQYYELIKNFYEIAKNGDFNLDDIQNSWLKSLQESGALPEDLTIDIGQRTIGISGNTTFEIDWDAAGTKTALQYLADKTTKLTEEEYEAAKAALLEAERSVASGDYTQIQYESVLMANGDITVENGKTVLHFPDGTTVTKDESNPKAWNDALLERSFQNAGGREAGNQWITIKGEKAGYKKTVTTTSVATLNSVTIVKEGKTSHKYQFEDKEGHLLGTGDTPEDAYKNAFRNTNQLYKDINENIGHNQAEQYLDQEFESWLWTNYKIHLQTSTTVTDENGKTVDPSDPKFIETLYKYHTGGLLDSEIELNKQEGTVTVKGFTFQLEPGEDANDALKRYVQTYLLDLGMAASIAEAMRVAFADTSVTTAIGEGIVAALTGEGLKTAAVTEKGKEITTALGEGMQADLTPIVSAAEVIAQTISDTINQNVKINLAGVFNKPEPETPTVPSGGLVVPKSPVDRAQQQLNNDLLNKSQNTNQLSISIPNLTVSPESLEVNVPVGSQVSVVTTTEDGVSIPTIVVNPTVAEVNISGSKKQLATQTEEEAKQNAVDINQVTAKAKKVEVDTSGASTNYDFLNETDDDSDEQDDKFKTAIEKVTAETSTLEVALQSGYSKTETGFPDQFILTEEHDAKAWLNAIQLVLAQDPEITGKTITLPTGTEVTVGNLVKAIISKVYGVNGKTGEDGTGGAVLDGSEEIILADGSTITLAEAVDAFISQLTGKSPKGGTSVTTGALTLNSPTIGFLIAWLTELQLSWANGIPNINKDGIVTEGQQLSGVKSVVVPVSEIKYQYVGGEAGITIASIRNGLYSDIPKQLLNTFVDDNSVSPLLTEYLSQLLTTVQSGGDIGTTNIENLNALAKAFDSKNYPEVAKQIAEIQTYVSLQNDQLNSLNSFVEIFSTLSLGELPEIAASLSDITASAQALEAINWETIATGLQSIFSINPENPLGESTVGEVLTALNIQSITADSSSVAISDSAVEFDSPAIELDSPTINAASVTVNQTGTATPPSSQIGGSDNKSSGQPEIGDSGIKQAAGEIYSAATEASGALETAKTGLAAAGATGVDTFNEISNASNSASIDVQNLGSQMDRIPSSAAGRVNALVAAINRLANLVLKLTVEITAQIKSEGPGGATGNVTVATANYGAVQRSGNFARWTTQARAKGTLMGELGPELIVSNGHYYVVGQNGPEMVDLADDAIVFNHLQTQSLLTKGHASTHGQPVTNERKATALAGGTGVGLASLEGSTISVQNLTVNSTNTNFNGAGGDSGSGSGGSGRYGGNSGNGNNGSIIEEGKKFKDEPSSRWWEDLFTGANAQKIWEGFYNAYLPGFEYNGTVDLSNRPMESAEAMAEAGWDIGENNYATIFGSSMTYGSDEEGYLAVGVTPILPDGSKLTPDELGSYVDELVKESAITGKPIQELDTKHIILGTDLSKENESMEDLNERFSQYLDRLHKAQEAWDIARTTVPGIIEKISDSVPKFFKKLTGSDSDGGEKKNPILGALGNVVSNVSGFVGKLFGGKSSAKGTLMGELGTELVVSNGRYFLVGQNGPEFVNLADDAIVFNHKQTASLFKHGKTSTRGRAVTNDMKAISFAKGNVNGGPAMASASAALAALKELRAQWKALLGASLKDLGAMGGGSGGGGGGGGDNKFYDGILQDVEQWYNWLRRIEALQTEINKLSKQYSIDEKNYVDKQQLYENLVNQYQAQLEILATEQDLVDEMTQAYNERLDAIQQPNSPLSAFYAVDENTHQLLIQGNEQFLEFLQTRADVSDAVRDALTSGQGTITVKTKLLDEDGNPIKDKKGNYKLTDTTFTIPSSGLDFLNELFKELPNGTAKYSAEAQFEIIKQLGLGKEFLQYDDKGQAIFDDWNNVTEEQMQKAVENWYSKIEGARDSIDEMHDAIEDHNEAALAAKQAIQALNESIEKLYTVTEGVVSKFEEYYNWNQLIAENQKNLNKLTKDYTILQKDYIANGKAMFQNLMDQVKALAQQRNTNEQLARERQNQQQQYDNEIANSALYSMFLQVDEESGRTFLTGDNSFIEALSTSATASEAMRQAAVNMLRNGGSDFTFQRTTIQRDEEGRPIMLDRNGNRVYNSDEGVIQTTTTDVTVQLPTSAQDLVDILMAQNEYGETALSAAEQFEILRQMGFLEDMRYDEKGKALFTNVDAMTDADKQKAVQNLLTKIQNEMKKANENVEAINKLNEENQGINSSLLQIQDQLNQVIEQVNNDIKEAIIAQREQLIDKLDEEKEALQEAADRLTNGLTEALNKEQKLYEADKNERNLRKLQAQLAAAQRSGASLSTIRGLQEQINDQQKSMYFDERQQQIDAIKEASDKQIQKLEDQIDIMKETLDYQKENGLLWNQVYEMLDTKTPEEIAAFIAQYDSDYRAASLEKQETLARSSLETLQTYKAMQEDARANNLSLQGYLQQIINSMSNSNGITDTPLSEVLEEVPAPQAETPTANDNPNLEADWTTYREAKIAAGGAAAIALQENEDTLRAIYEEAYRRAVTNKDRLGASNADQELATKTQEYLAAREEAFKAYKNAVAMNPNQLYINYMNDTNARDANGLTFKEHFERYFEMYYDEAEAGTDRFAHALELLNQNLYDTEAIFGNLYSTSTRSSKGIIDQISSGVKDIFTSDQMNTLRNSLLSNVNLAQATLSSFKETMSDLVGAQTLENINNENNNSVVIQHAEVNMNVEQMNDDYDARRAGEQALDEMVRIARKTGTLGVTRR